MPALPFLPRQGLHIVICIDCRVDPAQILGIELGDALVQRNIGGRVTPAVIADILSLLAGRKLAPPPAGPPPPLEALSGSEIRVLRYLPTNLSGPEIAGELYVSHNTVRTHISHLYAKLGTHTRAEAVARARALGLLAPSPLRGKATRPG